jgi:cytochrome c-type biogenesis protein CcmH
MGSPSATRPILLAKAGVLPHSPSAAWSDHRVFSFRKAAVLVAVSLLIATTLVLIPTVRAQETIRAKTLGQKLMCVCGCNQILISCNHVGCTYSHDMLKEVDARIARGDSDDLILQSFVQEYGPNVLAEPARRGFNWAAWIVPIAVPILSVYILWEVVRRWRQRAASAPAPSVKVPPELLARAKRESGEGSNE